MRSPAPGTSKGVLNGDSEILLPLLGCKLGMRLFRLSGEPSPPIAGPIPGPPRPSAPWLGPLSADTGPEGIWSCSEASRDGVESDALLPVAILYARESPLAAALLAPLTPLAPLTAE